MATASVHLLDVGHIEYGDAILCRVGGLSILIDGGKKASGRRTFSGPLEHPSIQDQIRQLLGQPFTGHAHVDLLVLTHCHSDHIGCLPVLLERGDLTCNWALMADPDLGFGRDVNDPDEPEPDAMPLARKIAFTLREQPLGRLTGSELADAIEDQAGQYNEYIEMLNRLQTMLGDQLVLYRGPAEAASPGLDALLAAFAPAGLRVLGPESDQLAKCAAVIRDRFIDHVHAAERVLAADAGLASTPAALYRAIAAGIQDAEPDASNDGKALNCQSIVLSLSAEGRQVLLTGDMQFADPGLSAIRPDINGLISHITNNGPYDFIKISHHGSHNGFNDALRSAWQAEYFGISTGANSGGHPHNVVLQVLQNTPGAQWIRNDRNGLCAFDFSDGGADLVIERGALNDLSGPAGADQAVPPPPEVRPPQPVPAPTVPAGEMIEVIARIPNRRTRVTITIDIAPDGGPPGPFPEPVAPATGLGGGRSIPPLLFVTNPEALAANVGTAEARQAMALLGGHPLALVSGHRPAQVAAHVQAVLDQNPQVQGVVIVGGYDVVPSIVLDVLPRHLRREVEYEEDNDADDYFVWNDDAYADRNSDGNAELPVSRVPDGCSFQLLRNALTASLPPRYQSRCGVRNLARPFADSIFQTLPGLRPLPSADPLRRRTAPADLFAGDLGYVMLHGDASDGRVLLGEDNRRNHHPAVDLSHVPVRPPAVLFTGACWGALIVDTPAYDYHPGTPLGIRGPDQSIALRSLMRGTNAFVGCTGSHYSPRPDQGLAFGAPMHLYFFQALLSGGAPAQALFRAKQEYRRRLPHAGPAAETGDIAVEHKIARQFTCLGLGW